MYNSFWYETLILPPLTPPSWMFLPAWVILYLTIFVALILFIVKPSFQSKYRGYAIFFSQLILNLLWSPAFFYLQNPSLALGIIILLDILVIFNIMEFKKVSKVSAALLVPYLIWILFATYLNLGIVILNN